MDEVLNLNLNSQKKNLPYLLENMVQRISSFMFMQQKGKSGRISLSNIIQFIRPQKWSLQGIPRQNLMGVFLEDI